MKCSGTEVNTGAVWPLTAVGRLSGSRLVPSLRRVCHIVYARFTSLN